jgi:Cu+-exporting ATPase
MSEANPMSIDPICGMTVDDATSIRLEKDGKSFYFCSTHCLEQFESHDPEGKSEACCG